MTRISIVGKTRGIGYVVSDPDGQLLDWKTSRFRDFRSKERLLEYLLNLIHLGDIAEVILPEQSNQKETEAAQFLRLLNLHLSAREIPQRFVGKQDLKAAFPKMSRYQIAESLCAEFKELSGYIPRKKKLWQSEDVSMLLFDAAAQLRAAN